MKWLSLCFTICAILNSGQGVSTKVDFEDESAVTNSSKAEDEDVEVHHTIVVSTKLKNANGNRKALHGNDGDSGVFSHNIARKDRTNKEDSGEVPVILGYKGVETTQIRAPDTRYKAPAYNPKPPPVYKYPESVFISRNIRDDYDVYPNAGTNPTQWKPSSFFNNINYWNHDLGTESNLVRIDRPYQNPGKLHRRITEDGVKEFYCMKCREMSGDKGCGQVTTARSRSWVETTTAKMKIDGKLAKLN